MVSDDAKGSVASRRRSGPSARKLGRARYERREQICIEIADFALEDGSEAFKPGARVY
jgi:hypothetical protein